MPPESLALFNETQWNALEQMEDVLALTGDLHQGLQSALNLLLNTLGRQGGALFLPRFCEHVSTDWTFQSAPEPWLQDLPASRSYLSDLKQQVMKTLQPLAGLQGTGLAGVFPIYTGERVFGALLVHGEPIDRAAFPLWQAFLRPFARAAAVHAAASGNHRGIPTYLELLRSRNTLRAMFDSLPISIYIIDNTYTLAAINNSRAQRTGETPRALVGRKCYEALHNRAEACPGCRAAETFATGEDTTRLSRTWLTDDRFEEWEINTYPISEERGTVIQAIVVEQDVTEKRNLEVNLIQSEKLAAVGQLAAGVAHEINNPLTAIIANAQILRLEIGQGNNDILESVRLIELAGTRAAQVVRNLLGIARKEKYEFEPVDLNETIQNAFSLVQHELVGHGIRVDLDLGAEMPLVIASKDQLQGVWINLMLNATDAISERESGLISITSCYTGSEFRITVTDNGKGIAQEHLSRVFDPFFTTKTAGRGTGLGLSVCMRSIRQHGGSIQVDSQQGEWTRFIVHLPGPR
jgi:C4-dicarboxylate-specific signal transduction histidine kinase